MENSSRIVSARHTDWKTLLLFYVDLAANFFFPFDFILFCFVGVQAPQRRQYGKFAAVQCAAVCVSFIC